MRQLRARQLGSEHGVRRHHGRVGRRAVQHRQRQGLCLLGIRRWQGECIAAGASQRTRAHRGALRRPAPTPPPPRPPPPQRRACLTAATRPPRRPSIATTTTTRRICTTSPSSVTSRRSATPLSSSSASRPAWEPPARRRRRAFRRRTACALLSVTSTLPTPARRRAGPSALAKGRGSARHLYACAPVRVRRAGRALNCSARRGCPRMSAWTQMVPGYREDGRPVLAMGG